MISSIQDEIKELQGFLRWWTFSTQNISSAQLISNHKLRLQRKYWQANWSVRSATHLDFEFTLEYFDWWKVFTIRSIAKENPFGNQIVSQILLKNETFNNLLQRYSGLSGQNVLGILYFLPWLAALIPGKTSGTDKMKEAVGTLHSVLKSTIDEHRQRFVPGSSPRDYIDAYLQQIEECEDPKSSFYDEEGGKSNSNREMSNMFPF